LKLHRKTFAPDVLHAARVDPFVSPTLDKLSYEIVNTLNPFEPTETVRAMWHDDVKTILQCLRDSFAVRWRSYWIPLASQNQNGNI
jgi:hypothetical protein